MVLYQTDGRDPRNRPQRAFPSLHRTSAFARESSVTSAPVEADVPPTVSTHTMPARELPRSTPAGDWLAIGREAPERGGSYALTRLYDLDPFEPRYVETIQSASPRLGADARCRRRSRGSWISPSRLTGVSCSRVGLRGFAPMKSIETLRPSKQLAPTHTGGKDGSARGQTNSGYAALGPQTGRRPEVPRWRSCCPLSSWDSMDPPPA